MFATVEPAKRHSEFCAKFVVITYANPDIGSNKQRIKILRTRFRLRDKVIGSV